MKKSFLWTESYSVGITEIDAQHKQFLIICDDIYRLSKQKRIINDEALNKLNQLIDYGSYHLGTEEELFLLTKYPDAAKHVKSHDAFRNQVREFKKQLQNNTADNKQTMQEVSIFSGNWLLNHILEMDKSYSLFLNEHGIY